MKHRKTFASIIALILAILMIAGVLISAFAYTASASRKDELQEKINELEERAEQNEELQQQVQDRLEENYDEVRALVEQKIELDTRIAGTHEKIDALNAEILAFNRKIAEKQEEIDASIAEREALNERYKLRIRAMEENGTISYWSVIFNSSSFADLISRIEMINEIAVSDQLMLEQLEQLTRRIEAERAELELEKKELEVLKQQLGVLEEELLAQRAESDAYIQQINADIGLLNALFLEYDNMAAELQEQIDEYQSEYDEIKAREEEARRKQLAAQQAAQNAAVSGSSTGKVDASGFLFPLPAGIGVSITSAYGYRYHPIHGNYTMHNGVDFAAPQGTAIYASKAGTVTVAGYGTINGNYIKLQHSDGTMTYYLHLYSFAVKEGDYVSQGQKIGTVGSTGSSTGPHLHFQIMVNGQSVNPMNYMSLQ